MAVTRSYSLSTANGDEFTAHLADCVNVGRTPRVRDQILAGAFHRIDSPAGTITVDKPFFYTDFDRNHMILVWPRPDRHRWQEAFVELDKMLKGVPDHISPPGDRKARVVFGLGELREKLIAFDAQLDDWEVELLKLYVVFDHSVLLGQQRLRVSLEACSPSPGADWRRLNFLAHYDHSPTKFRVAVPRSQVEKVLAGRPELEKWLTDKGGAFAPPAPAAKPPWVSVGLYSGANHALAALHGWITRFAENKPPDPRTDLSAIKSMLAALPSGNHLPGWAKQGLTTLFGWADKQGSGKDTGKLKDRLFEVRFGLDLDDEWYLKTDPKYMRMLWDVFRQLPDANVEGNTRLDRLSLDLNKRSTVSYYDQSGDDIVISKKSLVGPERFQNLVRHEVGHAVHEAQQQIVDQWLRKRFGWEWFEVTRGQMTARTEIHEWLKLAGWDTGLSSQQSAEVEDYLREAAGDGSTWDPPKNGPEPPSWCARDFGPRLAVVNTPTDWYEHYSHWHRVGDRAFFVNYWYQQLMSVNTATLDRLVKPGGPLSTYAAMSQQEFFAELYSLYQDLDDVEARKRIPGDVRDWLDKNVGTASAVDG